MKIPRNRPSEWMKCGCVNWAEKYPYAPDVQFRMWHDSKFFHIEFKVDEEVTKAEQDVPGGEVYMDSCVECFIQPRPESDPHYYNFEWNAAGHLFMACRTGRNDAERAPLGVLESVVSEPSLGKETFPETALGKAWTLKASIPASALFNAGLDSWDGLKCRMNVFKCGQGLSKLAFLTWAPVDTPEPNYHRSEFFRDVEFE